MFLILARISVIFFGVLTLSYSFAQNEIFVDGNRFSDIDDAAKNIKDNSRVYLKAGTYSGLKITSNNVELIGESGVVFSSPIEGKAAIVITGDNILISSIECYGIQVRHKNGACVRQSGTNLTLKNVYFHDSQQGILSGADTGRLIIEFSTFERLGFEGRAHGIYSSNDELIIRHSKVINSIDQAHEVKTRAKITTIEHSTIGSINTKDSRSIDNSNGGILIVKESVVMQGPNTVNGQLIGFGLEGLGRQREHRIVLENNIFLLERQGLNFLLGLPNKHSKDVELTVVNNVIIGAQVSDVENYSNSNVVYANRADGKLYEDQVPSIASLPFLLMLKSL